jgi:hypothetical protein
MRSRRCASAFVIARPLAIPGVRLRDGGRQPLCWQFSILQRGERTGCFHRSQRESVAASFLKMRFAFSLSDLLKRNHGFHRCHGSRHAHWAASLPMRLGPTNLHSRHKLFTIIEPATRRRRRAGIRHTANRKSRPIAELAESVDQRPRPIASAWPGKSGPGNLVREIE